MKRVLKSLKENEIIRRYITINSFDGVLTILGIIFASFVVHIKDPHIVLLPSLGAAIAMCVSGFWGAYAAEISEIKRSRKDLERHLMKKLHNTDFYKKNKKKAMLVAIVDGLSPFIASLIILIPFFIASSGVFSINLAYYISFGLVGLILIGLGMFLGRIAKENVVFHVFKMLLAGIVIGAIFYSLSLIGLL